MKGRGQCGGAQRRLWKDGDKIYGEREVGKYHEANESVLKICGEMFFFIYSI